MLDNRRKVIIDTDNGDDIDDLITLYFALNQDKVDIIGIVCSFLNAPLRVKQIEYVLGLFNRKDIPVFVGASNPIKPMHGRDIETIYCQYHDYYGESNGDRNYDAAINFMIDSARKYKDQLTILEVAPQTCLALAIQKDKEAFKNTPIVIMGGAFYIDKPEWNIECDAWASKVVLESGLDLTYVGLEVTEQTTLENPKYENLLLNNYVDDKFHELSECSNVWVKCSKRHIVLHDPLTFLTLIDDEICSFNVEHIAHIEAKDGIYTKIDNDSLYIAKVAYKVDLDKVYKHLETLVKGIK